MKGLLGVILFLLFAIGVSLLVSWVKWSVFKDPR